MPLDGRLILKRLRRFKMVYHWLGKPKSLVIPLVILSLLFIIACGSASPPDTSGTDAAKPTAER